MSSNDHTSDERELNSDQASEAVTRSWSLGSLRMREVSVRLTDIRKMRPELAALTTSPVPVKRGRGRPRKSLTQSPKITTYFSSKAALNESDHGSSDTSADRRRSLLADVNQIPSPRTPVRGSRRTYEIVDKENLAEGSGGEESMPGSLLKFVDSSGQDITMEVKVSATPEKASRTPDKKKEELESEPEIDEEKDFNAAFDKVKMNVSSSMQGITAVEKSVPKVSVENSPSLSMDDVLLRLNQENTVDSEVEYVVKGDAELDKDELSADDEDDMEDIPATSTAWSSITTLMMDSPQPLLTSPAKKKSPKKYQRSLKMSRLIDNEVTDDTDDGQDDDTRLKRKPLVAVNNPGSDDSDLEISFAKGPTPEKDCSFDDLATVIDFANNIAPPGKETAVVERTEPVRHQEAPETSPDVVVTEPRHTER